MREIKFRFYTNHYSDDKSVYERYPDDVALGDLMTGDYSEENEVSCGCQECNPVKVQYTGLKDKNGKEIYEGDILLWEDVKIKSEVVFEEGCFVIKHEQGGSDFISSKNMFEIIGNIYENPELIK